MHPRWSLILSLITESSYDQKSTRAAGVAKVTPPWRRRPPRPPPINAGARIPRARRHARCQHTPAATSASLRVPPRGSKLRIIEPPNRRASCCACVRVSEIPPQIRLLASLALACSSTALPRPPRPCDQCVSGIPPAAIVCTFISPPMSLGAPSASARPRVLLNDERVGHGTHGTP